jgi:hypothetical protein
MDVRRGRSELTSERELLWVSLPVGAFSTPVDPPAELTGVTGESRWFLLPAPKRVILAVVQQSQRLCLRRH